MMRPAASDEACSGDSSHPFSSHSATRLSCHTVLVMGDSATATARSSFRGDIQGLRAIAVGVVVLYHAGVPFLSGGYVGVDVFFVISGFLITTHLLTALERTGRIRLRDFYARRARRILPASFLILMLSVLAALIWFPPLLLEQVWRGAVATALYMPNVLFAADGTNYLAETTPSLFQHYWSLGIEEQFYIIWPLMLLLGWRLASSKRALLFVMLALVVLSFSVGVWLTFRQQPFAFFLLPTRAWELAMGGIVAFLLSDRSNILGIRTAAIVGWAGVAGILGCSVFFSSSTAFPGYWAVVPVLSTAMVILAGATRAPYGPGRALSVKPMLWIGAISYSLYLVHWPALILPRAAAGFTDELPLWAALGVIALCVPAAWLLFRFVEMPAREARWLTTSRPRRTLWLSLGASAVAIIVAFGALGYSNIAPMTAARTSTSNELTTPPHFTTYVPSNLTPGLRDASSDQPVLYADECHRSFTSIDATGCLYGDATAPRLALFGDSHAAQWFPALRAFADDNGYAVETFTKSSCPSVTADILRNGVRYEECDAWRSEVISHLNEDPPELVVLSNFGTAALTPSPVDYGAAWSEALGVTLDRLSARTVVIADTPQLHGTPAVCLSANLMSTRDCGLPSDEALGGPARDAEIEAAAERGVPVIDLSEYLCDARCEPVISGILAYRDAHHLTATFSELLAGPLAADMRDIL